MDKLRELADMCKGEVTLGINEHRSSYMSLEEWVGPSALDLGEPTGDAIVKAGTVVCCQFYPDTPTTCYTVYDYDINKCLDACIEIMKVRNRGHK
jgi:hypothetical protein